MGSLFKVVQASNFRDGLWDFSLWVVPDAEGASINAIKWVIYALHPCFPNPNRVVRNHQQGFRLAISSDIQEEATWGRFDVRVTIVTQSGQREAHIVPLDLRTPAQSPAPALLPVEDGCPFDYYVRIYEFLRLKSAYALAREVLAKAALALPSDDAARRLWLAQQAALCTYKDPSLPADARLSSALEILRAAPCSVQASECRNVEALALAGAIYKRLWDLDRSRRTLESALHYSRRSFELMLERRFEPDYDGGAFSGSNLSYLYDLMAVELSDDSASLQRAECLAEAAAIRKRLLANLGDMQVFAQAQNSTPAWWIAATLLEAAVALATQEPRYEKSALAQARIVQSLTPSAWQLQSTGLQLLKTRRLHQRLFAQHAQHSEGFFRSIVAIAFGAGVSALDYDGKLGLALSGGGFRASLFHIGVLARLAELDLLRHVEVLSCVSGGSIVGAHYYLLLRNLLQSKPDEDICAQDYIELVRELLDQFLRGVQKNIRMSVAASLKANISMIFRPGTYSRTERLGELYEKYLYAQVDDDEGEQPRWLNEAFIVPRRTNGDWWDGFSPRLDNWRRANKVPTLVLNATSLNTGRNWQFTASWMGEPISYGTEVDATERLQPVYFSEAPERLTQYRFGHAVAASSCVPGLFTPIVINQLYPDRTVRLVDGGVHDNQGTRSLLDQDCDGLIVSDASGQMDAERNPAHGEISVVARTNSVLQARVRVAQHQELQARNRFGLLRECTFLHLRKRIEAAPVAGLGGVTATRTHADAPMQSASDTEARCTEYGLNKELQRCLSKVRTDLDSFTDREALTLMFSGYAMASKYLPALAPGSRSQDWRFFAVREAAGAADERAPQLEQLLRHIRVASRLPLKVWHLQPLLHAIGLALLLSIGAGALFGLHLLANDADLASVEVDVAAAADWALNVAVGTLLIFVAPWARRWVKRTEQASHPVALVWKVAFGIVMAVAGALICRLHLWTFDKLFIRLGRVPPHTDKPRISASTRALGSEG